MSDGRHNLCLPSCFWKELEVVTPREDVMDAFQKLAQKEMLQIPVVQNGKLIGMLRRRDILRWLQLHSEMIGS